MSQLVYPDYTRSTLNIPAAILRHYGAETPHPALPELCDQLSAAPKHVVLMVLDGMGIDMLRHNLPENSCLRRHMAGTLTSVFPPTTTAAMTSYYSGLSPIEHGWLGWSAYFKEYSRMVDLFRFADSYSGEPTGDVASELMPYTSIYENIHAATNGTVKTHSVIPANIPYREQPNIHHKTESLSRMFETVAALCRLDERSFVMAYWPDPDASMHQHGCYSDEARAVVEEADRLLERLSGELSDTLLILSADHGHIDIEHDLFLNDTPELVEMLLLPPMLESRALSLFVKPGRLEAFRAQFERHYGAHFLLLSRDEVLRRGLFGPGAMHPKADDFIGDYLAIATGTAMLRYRANNASIKVHRSQHAGLRPEEMLVPLVIIER